MSNSILAVKVKPLLRDRILQSYDIYKHHGLQAAYEGWVALGAPLQYSYTFGKQTNSGVYINPTNASSLGVYYACMRAISEDLGKLPMGVYQGSDREDGSVQKTRRQDHPLDKLLRHFISPEMSAQQFKETMNAWALGWGKGIAEIEFDRAGKPRALWPIHPANVIVKRDQKDYRILYDVYRWKGEGSFLIDTLENWQVFHLRGLSQNGLTGDALSILASQAIGIGLTAELYAATFFNSDSRPGGTITFPAGVKTNPQSRKAMRQEWDLFYAGADKAHRTAILPDGAKFEPIAIPPVEAQLLQARQFQVEEIARWFRMPLHKVGHLMRINLPGMEQQAQEYVTDTLMPWANRWEEEAWAKLLTDKEKEQGLFLRYDFDELLRGDQVARSTYYRNLWGIGAKTPNEIRSEEGDNPVENGDDCYVPTNYQTLKTAKKNEDKPAQPAPNPFQKAKPGQTTDGTEPQTPPENAPGTPAGEPKSVVSQKEIFFPLIYDAVNTVNRKESLAVKKANDKNQNRVEFDQWHTEFLQGQVKYLIEKLSPIMSAFEKFSGRNISRETLTKISEQIQAGHLQDINSISDTEKIYHELFEEAQNAK